MFLPRISVRFTLIQTFFLEVSVMGVMIHKKRMGGRCHSNNIRRKSTENYELNRISR